MRIYLEKSIFASAEKTFALLTDPDRFAGVIKAIKKVERLTDGPVGVGTSFRETREVFGREHSETLTFTHYEPNRSYTLSADSCGCRMDSRFDLEPNEQGVTVRMTTTSHAYGFLARIMAPITWLMQGSMRKMLEQDLADIKAAAESSP